MQVHVEVRSCEVGEVTNELGDACEEYDATQVVLQPGQHNQQFKMHRITSDQCRQQPCNVLQLVTVLLPGLLLYMCCVSCKHHQAQQCFSCLHSEIRLLPYRRYHSLLLLLLLLLLQVSRAALAPTPLTLQTSPVTPARCTLNALEDQQ
jgi:hypothetical protein